jgi:hypothetical protein
MKRRSEPQKSSATGLTVEHVIEFPNSTESAITNSNCHSFLTLPGELRNQVYSYLIFPNLKEILVRDQEFLEEMYSSVLSAPIYRTCRQVRNEALSYLCSQRQITFLNFSACSTFISCSGESGRTNLSHIKLTRANLIARKLMVMGNGEEVTVITFFLENLKKLSGLKSFELVVHEGLLFQLSAEDGSMLKEIRNVVEELGADFVWSWAWYLNNPKQEARDFISNHLG